MLRQIALFLVVFSLLAPVPARAQTSILVTVSFYCSDYGAYGRATSPVPRGTAQMDGDTDRISANGTARFYVTPGSHALWVNGVVVGRIVAYRTATRAYGILCASIGAG